MGKYDDIINLPHHQSKKRKHMSMHDRAAQFAPYMSLSGFGDEISETARLTDSSPEIGDERAEKINFTLQTVKNNGFSDEITLTYFVPDEKKTGGAYITVKNTVRKIDDIEKKLILSDRSEIKFENIFDISINDEQ